MGMPDAACPGTRIHGDARAPVAAAASSEGTSAPRSVGERCR